MVALVLIGILDREFGPAPAPTRTRSHTRASCRGPTPRVSALSHAYSLPPVPSTRRYSSRGCPHSSDGLLSDTQSTSRGYTTASTTGLMNSPMMPKAMSPPITPAKIDSSGRSAPRLIGIGRRKLPKVPQKIAQTRPSGSSTSTPGRGRCSSPARVHAVSHPSADAPRRSD